MTESEVVPFCCAYLLSLSPSAIEQLAERVALVLSHQQGLVFRGEGAAKNSDNPRVRGFYLMAKAAIKEIQKAICQGAKLFVEWDASTPSEQWLTYRPSSESSCRVANLQDVVNFTSIDLDIVPEYADIDYLLDNIETGDVIELEEGFYVASWITHEEVEGLFFVDISQGTWHQIW